MTYAVYAIVALVALQRLIEIQYANRNTKALLERGAIEVGRGHYPVIVLLHAAWLAAIVAALPAEPSISWPLIGVFVALQAARVWVIASLGPYWTTRIISLKAAPLVRHGPYKFLRHPNYVVVALEIAVLPLAFGESLVALVFSILNASVLFFRIREEERTLRPRRAFGDDEGAGPKSGADAAL
jgi:methyltransferase